MSASNKKQMSLVIVAVVAVAGLQAVIRLEPAQAQRGAAPAGVAQYTVVATEGHNLIVTDNATNTLCFYTIDPEAEIGSDLKLRGTVDLNLVGKPVITPKTHK